MKYLKILIKILLFFLAIISFTVLNFFIDKKNLNIKVCVCTCGKNENNYIREFVSHYNKYGVDKIFIYDNNNKNGENFETILSDYIENGLVKIIDFRDQLKIQMTAFNHCYQENKNLYDWFIFYDMDEFIHLEKYNDIKAYLGKASFNKCKIIYLNHVIRTDNNQLYYNNQSLFVRFPQSQNYKNVNNSYQPRRIILDLTKIIIRGRLQNIYFTNPHLIFHNNNTSCNGFGKIINHTSIHLDKPDHKKFYFDHFYFKSSEEYLNKLNKESVFYGIKRGYHLYWLQIYFAYNEITKEKLDYYENKTGLNLSIFRDKISSDNSL